MTLQLPAQDVQSARKHLNLWKRTARVKTGGEQPRPTTVTVEEVLGDLPRQVGDRDANLPHIAVQSELADIPSPPFDSAPQQKRRGSIGSSKTLIGSLSQYSASLRSGGTSLGTSSNDDQALHAPSLRRSQTVQKVHIVVRKKVLPADEIPESGDAAHRRTGSEQLEPVKTSFLAKKASQFGNAQLSKSLPPFELSLSAWALVCRAAQASFDVYSKRAQRSENAMYVSADRDEGTKAMSVEDHVIDGNRVVVVSIRGTQFQSLADWTVNYAHKPEQPIDVLDDPENLCHDGFYKVTKAMIGLVAIKLQQHTALSKSSSPSAKPLLLFTGHSAGGAVCSLLCAHILSKHISSDLIELAPRFSAIHCVTFGAPPISMKALQRSDSQRSGLFLAFANEGDPVVRVSNAGYVKSLAKLLTASTDDKKTKAKTKSTRIRAGRGYAPSSWRRPSGSSTHENDSPHWEIPAAAFANAGDLVLLREDMKSKRKISAHSVTSEEIQNALFGDLAQHSMCVYQDRVSDLAYAAIVGRAPTRQT